MQRCGRPVCSLSPLQFITSRPQVDVNREFEEWGGET